MCVYVQIVVHDGDVQADVVHAVRRDVEDDGLVVGWIQGVLLDAGFLLFQAPPVTYERHFDVRVCRGNEGQREPQPRGQHLKEWKPDRFQLWCKYGHIYITGHNARKEGGIY